MGCDIHLFVEKRESASAPWKPVLIKTPCGWCNASGKGRDDRPCYGCKGTTQESGYGDRNYDVFAMLANVRNGSGFAGCDTGDGFVPLDEPRGLPSDLSAELKDVYSERGDDTWDKAKEAYGCGWFGDHSHSWATLRELNDYDYSRTTKHRGWVDAKEFVTFKEKGKPGSWNGGVTGSAVKHVGNAEMAALIEHGGPTQHTYTQVEWSSTYAQSAGRFYDVFLPALRDAGDPDNVRIVFGFDS